MGNQTIPEYFVLVGFPMGREAEILFIIVLLVIYLLTLFGNMAVLLVIATTNRLHTPMYFFLANLSFLDFGFSTSTVPSFLRNLISEIQIISYAGCLAQSYFYFLFSTVEFFLLTCMSYDRYVAICNPLRYPAIMNSRVCIHIVSFCWLGGFCSVLYPTIIIPTLSFCKSSIIDHFFCDSEPMVKLACNDTRLLQLVILMLISVVVFWSLVLTVISYAYIASTILRIPSGAGRKKAFNTCAAHLTLFLMSTIVSILLYVIPSEKASMGARKLPAFLSSIVNPFLSPFVYTLRNDLFQGVLGEIFGKGKAVMAHKLQKLLQITCSSFKKKEI